MKNHTILRHSFWCLASLSLGGKITLEQSRYKAMEQFLKKKEYGSALVEFKKQRKIGTDIQLVNNLTLDIFSERLKNHKNYVFISDKLMIRLLKYI